MRRTYRLKPQRSAIHSILQGLSAVTWFIVLVASVSIALTLKSGTILAVQTASMVPVFSPGDALVISTSPKVYSVGDIVSYRSRLDQRQLVSHRIVAINEKDSQLVTKGDDLKQPDPPIRNWDVAGKVIYIIPKAGYILNFVYSWWGLVLTVYLPAVFVLFFEVRQVNCKISNTYSVKNSRKRIIVIA